MLQGSLLISALSGGSGKTMFSLGLARALYRQGHALRAYKKGPDYIDAAWLSLAANCPSGNLDLFFLPDAECKKYFYETSCKFDFALIEGNRGLFDGLDLSGSCSSAELAKLLEVPVILVLDCTKMTRTAAALVFGCIKFDPGLHIAGVILNRVGNPRHERIIRQSIETYCSVPVLGALPRKKEPFIDERSMGLHGVAENRDALERLDKLADFVTAHADIQGIKALAQEAWKTKNNQTAELMYGNSKEVGCSSDRVLKCDDSLDKRNLNLNSASFTEEVAGTTAIAQLSGVKNIATVTIGYVKDKAFWFYYSENIAALEKAGAKLVELSLLSSQAWPGIDGLYIGGGFPELYAQELSDNSVIRRHVKTLSCSGVPIYAESGGFMYLTDSLLADAKKIPMVGIFPFHFIMCRKPQGLGYVQAEVIKENPFFNVGCKLAGHEFHFSKCLALGAKQDYIDSKESISLDYMQGVPEQICANGNFHSKLVKYSYVLQLGKGSGCISKDTVKLDGCVVNNTYGAYTQVYAPATPCWAVNFVQKCREQRTEKSG